MDNYNEQNTSERGFDMSSENHEQQERTATQKSGMLLPAPHGKLILTLGILSIPAICCCNGTIGIILAIIAIILSITSKREFNRNSDLYDASTFSRVKTGRTCAIIGLIAGIIMLVFAIILLNKFFGSGITGFTNGCWDQLGY